MHTFIELTNYGKNLKIRRDPRSSTINEFLFETYHLSPSIDAKRKLVNEDGTIFFETVAETNGFDSIRFLRTEHPFPCKVLYAHLSTEKVDDNNCIFSVVLEFELNEGVDLDNFVKANQWLAQKTVDMGKQIMESNSHLRFPTLNKVQGEAKSKFIQKYIRCLSVQRSASFTPVILNI